MKVRVCGVDSAGIERAAAAAGLPEADGVGAEAVPAGLGGCSSPPSEEQPAVRARAASAVPERSSERRDGPG